MDSSSRLDLFLLFKAGWDVFEKKLSDAKSESCTDTATVQGGIGSKSWHLKLQNYGCVKVCRGPKGPLHEADHVLYTNPGLPVFCMKRRHLCS
jgi:hypothetical protein